MSVQLRSVRNCPVQTVVAVDLQAVMLWQKQLLLEPLR